MQKKKRTRRYKILDLTHTKPHSKFMQPKLKCRSQNIFDRFDDDNDDDDETN